MCKINCSGGCIECAPEEHLTQEEENEELAEKIINLTASYAALAYDWDLREEEDLDDYKGALLKLLQEYKE
jgi:hypothetical protein